jgi:hypothetical protein
VGLVESLFFFFFFFLSAFSFSFTESSSFNSSSALASSPDFVSPESSGLRVGVHVEDDLRRISALPSKAQSKVNPAASRTPRSQNFEFGATMPLLQKKGGDDANPANPKMGSVQHPLML